MDSRRLLIGVIVACIASGCQSARQDGDHKGGAAGGNAAVVTRPDAPILAYVSGQPVTAKALTPALIEAAGGEVFSDVVLDLLVAQRLSELGQSVTPEMVDHEKQIISQTLSDDPDEAARLLRSLREQRGLGEQRFEALLRRNAGLRFLVRERVTVTDAAVEQAYRLAYGPAVRVRLLMTNSLSEAADLRRQIVDEGKPFGELAAMHSTDPSAAQGGLLSPIRQEDTSYPQAIRSGLVGMDVGEVSAPIAIDGGFVILRVEEKIAGAKVEFDDVKQRLAEQTRHRAERVLMQQAARELVSGANIVVLDAPLKQRWDAQQATLIEDR